MTSMTDALTCKTKLETRGVVLHLDGADIIARPRFLITQKDVEALRTLKPQIAHLLRVERAINAWSAEGAPPFDLGEPCGDGLVTWWPAHLRKHSHELEAFENLMGIA